MTKARLVLNTGETVLGNIITITEESYLIEWPNNTPIWVLKERVKLYDNGYPIRLVEIINETKTLLYD